MYYAIKVWDKDNHVVEEETTSIIEELPEKFSVLDAKYPAAEGYTVNTLYIPETCCVLKREEARAAMQAYDIDAIQKLFDTADEVML